MPKIRKLWHESSSPPKYGPTILSNRQAPGSVCSILGSSCPLRPQYSACWKQTLRKTNLLPLQHQSRLGTVELVRTVNRLDHHLGRKLRKRDLSITPLKSPGVYERHSAHFTAAIHVTALPT